MNASAAHHPVARRRSAVAHHDSACSMCDTFHAASDLLKLSSSIAGLRLHHYIPVGLAPRLGPRSRPIFLPLVSRSDLKYAFLKTVKR